jgi:hypothetical protein
MPQPALPCINPNPDIAGIGVRVSIYTQAFLNLVCTAVIVKDGWISPYRDIILTKTSTNLLLTGCALLVSSFIQAKTIGFSVYHALIVLNLSWVNNSSAVLYATIAVLEFLEDHLRKTREEKFNHFSVMLLSVFHLSGMGAFGIWVWAKILTFGNQPECTPITFLTVFGYDITATSTSLRKGSIGLYSIATIPFLNFFVVFLAGLFIDILFALAFAVLSSFGSFWSRDSRRRWMVGSGVVVIALLEVLFIVDTELMISRSSTLVKDGESQWSFGQTLAMVMVILPLLETVKAGFKSWKEPEPAPGGHYLSALVLMSTRFIMFPIQIHQSIIARIQNPTRTTIIPKPLHNSIN